MKMKLCLVNIVLMVLMTSYKGMVGGEEVKMSPGALERDARENPAGCTNEYRMSHEGVRPGNKYLIAYKKANSATICKDWCNKDARCRSVALGGGYCAKYTMSVQELKDKGRGGLVYNDTDQHGNPMHIITYDRYCAECTKEYRMSHEGVRPGNKYQIAYKKTSSATICKDWCNKDARCRSVVLGNGYCAKFSISVQELKNKGRGGLIYNDTDQHGNPMHIITYDRYCGEFPGPICIYPVSHSRMAPVYSLYGMDSMQDNSATTKTCWDYCSEDENCKSVRIRIDKWDRRWCHKYNIAVQVLKDMGRDNEIWIELDTYYLPTYITYDKYCEVLDPMNP